ncbi:MAG: hypothetical protein WD229_18775 [Pirellulales bacterium]
MSAQFGHANPSTSSLLRALDAEPVRRWVDLLDRAARFIAAQVGRLVPDLEPIWNQNTNRAPPMLWKRPIHWVGRQGLEPLIKSHFG